MNQPFNDFVMAGPKTLKSDRKINKKQLTAGLEIHILQ